MDLLPLPLNRHFALFTHKGFATFSVINENDYSFTVQDLPMRFVINVLSSDLSNIIRINERDRLKNQLKFYCLKYFGAAAIKDKTLKEVLTENEKPLAQLLDSFPIRNQKEIEGAITKAHCGSDKALLIQEAPLYVFTRNGIIAE